MIRNAVLVACDRLAWVIVGLIVSLLSATPVFTQATPPPPPAQQAQAAPPARVFTSDAGLVLNFIKPDKTKDFEAVIAKVNTQSGIRMRVNRKRPTHVARHSPAYIPAFLPKAHCPKRSTDQQSRTENKASGIRADQSWTPNSI